MTQALEIATLPMEAKGPLEIPTDSEKEKEKDVEKDPAMVMDAEISEKSSVAAGEIQDDAVPSYSEEEYRKLKRKADRYLLPLMWLCYGIQQTDKTSIGTQATFGLSKDTGLHGQQYSWLTTVFYITYMCFEFPSNIILQRYLMGRTLSCYMLCWGVVVLCVGFAQNFTQLVTLRALQGFFECCISPGFILVVGSWYTTREHASRSLVFQSANAGFGVIANLILYGIGSVQYKRGSEFQAWRYMSYFLGSMTILVGCLCLFLLGTPSEVRWLSPEEKKIANARILSNNTGHDKTGIKKWKWKQARECLIDPCFWFAGLNAFLNSVPNGGITAFGSIINTNAGFTNLQVILLDIPKNITSVLWFVCIGIITSRKKNLRLYFMMVSVIPPVAGFAIMASLPNEPQYKWTKWTGFFITVPCVVALFLAWTLIPSNVAGRTKRTLTSSFTFVGYCVGNMVGSQIFKAKDAPRYIPGTAACAVCFGLEFFLLVAWRVILVTRNRRREKQLAEQGISEEERIERGKQLGEQDCTDFENPYFRYTM
ncbi:MFS general substrate transporter [Annulohypoxylon maeteangense]|uniref:MFS general substrate transporter n=1 Tax=Annulohypoxylon maeteangense TaxID=1927788 RepID=UPI002007B1D4|nr:MFS general substrate transporter [Annulohypoxylon maeteangense]KAI0880641.1 MFS general substrate transporter [Annulohypoxylon maeteangense]